MYYLKAKIRKYGEVKVGIILFGISLILGLFFAIAFKSFYWNNVNLFDEQYIAKIKVAVFDHSKLLKYVLWHHLKLFFLLWIFCSTALGIPYILLTLVYTGFRIGLFVTVIMMRYGLKGILLLFGYSFPQFLIYIPVAFISLRVGYWLCKSMYHETKLGTKGKVERVVRHLGLIFILGVVLCLGCLVETYIGSFLLQKIMYFF